MATTNVQLAKHCRGVKTFRGVFCKDQLPAKRLPGFYIINMQDHDEGDGTHWVLLQVKPHSNWYFDSFAGPPPVAVRQFTTGPLYYNNGMVQGMDSDHCGRFCCYVMKRLNRGESLNEIIKGFTASAKANDGIVVRAWRRH